MVVREDLRTVNGKRIDKYFVRTIFCFVFCLPSFLFFCVLFFSLLVFLMPEVVGASLQRRPFLDAMLFLS